MATDDDMDLNMDDFEMDLEDLGDFSDPGSEEDPQGVWVKEGPEDVPSLENDPITRDEATPSEEGFADDDQLSPDELANLDDSFDFVEASPEDLGDVPERDDFEDFSENIGSEDPTLTLGSEEPENSDSLSSEYHSFDEIDVENFVSFEEDVDTSGGIKEEAGISPSLPTEADNTEEFLDIDIDINDEVPDSELEIYEEERKNAVDEVSLDEFLNEDFDENPDMSNFGDLEVEDVSDEDFSSPQEIEEEAQAIDDLLEEPENISEEVEIPIEDEMDFDSGVEDSELIETDDYFVDVDLDSTEEEDFSDDFEQTLSQEKDDFSMDLDDEFDESNPADVGHDEDMESIIALEENLTQGIKTPVSSDTILLKLEQELSSIRNELGDLKKEISTLKGTGSSKETEDSTGGFFSDDEDETIALTGEELDNILTSAEVKEEQPPSLDEQEFSDETIPQDHEDFFGGTDLQETLDQEVEIPESTTNHPLPGGDIYEETDDLETSLPLDEDETREETIPEEISLLETENTEIETEDLMGDSEEELEEPLDVTSSSLPDLNEVDEVSSEISGLSAQDIDFEESDSIIELDSEFDEGFESIDLDDMGSDSIEEDEESLEIPFDDDLSLDEDILGSSSQEIQEEAQEMQVEKPEPTHNGEPPLPGPQSSEAAASSTSPGMPANLRNEIANVLKYMDNLLDALPDEKIKEFAESEHFEVYKKLFEELGLME